MILGCYGGIYVACWERFPVPRLVNLREYINLPGLFAGGTKAFQSRQPPKERTGGDVSQTFGERIHDSSQVMLAPSK